MDKFNFNINVEKANAIRKHRQLQKLAGLLRVVEICLVLALISRFSVKIPFPVNNSSGYFKDLTVILASPRFVFVIGNAIVITLFAKSGQFSGQGHAGKSSRNDLYEEFIEKSHISEAAYTGKQSTYVQCVVAENTRGTLEAKSHRRSQSEILRRPKQIKPGRELRRSVTEKCRGSVESSGVEELSFPEDSMSNEEFRFTVEAFIERQKRFRRDEENSVF